MKKSKRLVCVLLVLYFVIQISACGSDYPVVNRKLDVSSLINASFEGTGYNINLPETEVVVSAVGDRMSIDMEQSEGAFKLIRESVKSAVPTDDGLTGTWTGYVDISSIICESFESIEGLNLRDGIGEIMLAMTITFTDDGFYIIKFNENDIEKAEGIITEKAAKTAKTYLESSGSIGKAVSYAVSDNTLENVIAYVVGVVNQMLENGSAGTYVRSGSKLKFDGENSCDIVSTSNNITLSGLSGDGILACFADKPVHLSRK